MISARTITHPRLIGLDLDRLIPVMICRMIISLKKAASSQQLLHMNAGPSDVPSTNVQDASPPSR